MKTIYALLLSLLVACPAWAANEIQVDDASLTGQALYVVVKNSSNHALTTGTTFGTYTSTRGDFDQAVSEVTGTGLFYYSFPLVASGHYTWTVYQQAGGSPSASNDVPVWTDSGFWTGAAFGSDLRAVNGDTSAAGNLERTNDGRGYGAVRASGTIDTVTNQTTFDLNWAASGMTGNTDVDVVGATLVIREGVRVCQREILTDAYVSASRLNVTIDSAAPWNVTTSATYEITDRKFPTYFSLLGISSTGDIEVVEEVEEEVSASSADFNDDPVPESRKWKLKAVRDNLLVGEFVRTLAVGKSATFAVDFGVDLSANRGISSVSAPTIYSGTSGGVTFGTPAKEDSEEKVRITGVTAGTYVLQFDVTYDDGTTQRARVTLKTFD